MPRKKKPGRTVSPPLAPSPGGLPGPPTVPGPYGPTYPDGSRPAQSGIPSQYPSFPGGGNGAPDQVFENPLFNIYGPGNRPPNLLDPYNPGYPTNLNLPPNPGDISRGGPYSPGPSHPAYPPPELHGPGGIPGFAKGGDFITDGPQTIMVGEGGPERVQVQPLGGYDGPPVMGPGQGVLPLPDQGSSADDFFGPFGTGQRGTGPSPATGTGPFEQTFDDFSNLFDYGTTAPHWSEQQMLKAYGMSPFRAAFNRGPAERSITSAEIDRIFRNVSGGLGHYTGMIPSLFGDGPAAGGQWSVPPHPPGSYGPPPRGTSQDAFDEFNRGNPYPQADEADQFMRPIPPAPPIPPGQQPGLPGGGGWQGNMKRKRQALINLLRGRKPPPRVPPQGLSDLF